MRKTFQQMMEKMMSGMMKPEDMPHMKEAMMDNIFKQMGAQDRLAFMQNMMPRCMAMMFAELAPADRREVAEGMLRRMMDELKGQLKG